MYTKQTWADGDIITAVKLNHIEDGIADAEECKLFVVTVTNTSQDATPVLTPSMTYDEVMVEVRKGRMPVYKFVDSVDIGFRPILGYTPTGIKIGTYGSEEYQHDYLGINIVPE